MRRLSIPFRVVVAGAVVVALLAVGLALRGDDGVPDLVGVDECTATDRLVDRGLRWRFGDRAPVGGVPHRCNADGGIGSVADPIEGQRPAPGTKLDDGAVVVLETACTREPACSRSADYATP